MHILQCWKIHFFVFVWRWWCSEWARSTDTTATKITVDTAFLPPVACSTHTYRGPRGKMTVRHHTSMMALCHLVFTRTSQRLSHCLWWRLPDIITGARTVLTWDLLPNLIWVQNVCVSGNNNTNGTVLHSILQQYHEKKQIITNTLVSGFCRQQEWSWQDRR